VTRKGHTLLGVISSSCSYAASAMARALFARRVVDELDRLHDRLDQPGYRARRVALSPAWMAVRRTDDRRTGRHHPPVFSSRSQLALRERVLVDSPPPTRPSSESWRERLRTRENYSLAARFTMGDLTMLRKELLAGFLIAGFISFHVPATW
jgi:hypothetical protein